MRFCIVLCIFGLAAASFDYTGRPTLEDLQQFYSSGQPIYMLKRSFELLYNSDHVICIYNEKQAFEDRKLTLKEAYALGTSVYYYTVTIRLTPGEGRDDAPVMEATPGQYKWSDFSTKQTWGGGRYERITRCELHFWASAKTFVTPRQPTRKEPSPPPSGFENCEREYKNLCPNATSYKVYNHECEGWFPSKLRGLPWQPVLDAENKVQHFSSSR
uniref:Lipocalin n=1 Tax=Rhipicephalus appendiculatus TaxID=34631 RepID=A0A131Z7K4_RHIAP